MAKLKKIKAKKTQEAPMELRYKPSFHFDSSQIGGIGDGKIGQTLNISVEGKLVSISQEQLGEKKPIISYRLEIGKMSIPKQLENNQGKFVKTKTKLNRQK